MTRTNGIERAVATALCALLLLAAAGAVRAQGDAAALALVNTGLEAMGGAARVDGLKSLVVSARHAHWDPQQTEVPGVGNKPGGTSRFTTTRNLANGHARIDWVRNRTWPGIRMFQYSEVFADDVGFVLGIDNIALSKMAGETSPSMHTMSASRRIANLRELHRSNPRLLLEMARNADKLKLAANAKAGDKVLPAVTWQAADAEWTVLFDPATGLPARIRTVDADNIWGDSDYDLALADWRVVDGVRFPFAQLLTLRGREVQKIDVDEVLVNRNVPPDLFAVPELVKKASAAESPPQVNYQWMIRRAHWGSFLDSDKIAFDPAVVPQLKWTEVKPGIFHITGGSHHTMVIELKDSLIAIDAPVANEMSRMTVEEAKKRFPNKPFKHLVMTHHHMDHAGGTRVFAALGAQVLVGAGNKAFFEDQFSAPNRVRNDELWANPRKVEIVEVADSHKISDGTRDVMLYVVPNTHSASTLVLTVPKDDFGWVTDLWSPARDRANDRPSHFEFAADIRRRNIVMTTWAGGHGSGPAPVQPLLDALDKIRVELLAKGVAVPR